jgi:hypothetical protein
LIPGELPELDYNYSSLHSVYPVRLGMVGTCHIGVHVNTSRSLSILFYTLCFFIDVIIFFLRCFNFMWAI